MATEVLPLRAGAGRGTKRPVQLSPMSLPRTIVTTTWGLGRLGRTLLAAIQTSFSKNRDNLSHLTGKVNDSGSLSQLAFLLTISQPCFLRAGYILRWVSPLLAKMALNQPQAHNLAWPVAPVEPFLMVPAIVS